MNTNTLHFSARISQAFWLVLTAFLLSASPAIAQAGNVAWSVAVGGGYGGGYGGPYGGGWRPLAYGPGWGGGPWGPGWQGGYGGPAYGYPYGAGYYAPPVVYASPPQPLVLAAQPQPPVWYYCEASKHYFPYVQHCSSGWQTQVPMPPSSNTPSPQRIQP